MCFPRRRSCHEAELLGLGDIRTLVLAWSVPLLSLSQACAHPTASSVDFCWVTLPHSSSPS